MWQQSINDARFRQQIEWELTGQEQADLIIVNFVADTKSPITLLELGMAIGRANRTVVCCPDGFWRKGNVDIVCKRYNIRQFRTFTETLFAAIDALTGRETTLVKAEVVE